MKIDIVPIHDDISNCLEDIMISMAAWLKIDNYNYAFALAWDFYYLPVEKRSEKYNSIENNLGCGEKKFVNIIKMSEKIYGLTVIEKNANSFDDVLHMIKESLENKMPLLVSIDAFWCPWNKGMYQEYHHPHSCLIVDIDEEKKEVCCVDAFPLDYGSRLSYEYLEKGSYLYGQFNYNPKNVKYTWKDIINLSIENLKINGSNKLKFEGIRDFAEDLCNHMDINKEIEGYEDAVWSAPIFERIDLISSGKKQFARLLKDISSNEKETSLDFIANKLEKISNEWSTLKGLLIKSYYKKNFSFAKYHIADKLNEVADEEIELFFEMEKVVSGEYNKLESLNNPSSINDQKYKDIKQINIESYFNNKGIGNDINSNNKADLTDTGDGNKAFFLADLKMLEREWIIDNMKFSFPDISEEFDNISCDAQEILISCKDNIFDNIMFLGCAEWGNYSEKCIIKYETGETEEIYLEFTDWYFSPVYKEKIAWEGHAVERKLNTSRLAVNIVHLGCQNYKLKKAGKIKNVILPKSKNIHIFSLSLGLSE